MPSRLKQTVIDFLTDNAMSHTPTELGTLMGMDPSAVRQYFHRNNIPYMKTRCEYKRRKRTVVIERLNNPLPPAPKVYIDRSRNGGYSNVSREQIINQYLNS